MTGSAEAGAATPAAAEEQRTLPGVLRLAVRAGALELETAQEREVVPVAAGEAVHVLDGHLHPRPGAGDRGLVAAFYYFDAPGVTVRLVRDGGAWYVLASRSAHQAVL
ncbi:MAG: hypothetical protein QJR08_08680 [Bacillota bacterium]|nr:hypothetical protein [Bacillota bacterium]